MPSPPDASRSAPIVDEAESLAGHLHRLAGDLIDDEVRRLAHKLPSLSETDMQKIAYALDELVEQLLAGR